MESIKTKSNCFDALWSNREKIVSRLTERFGNQKVGVRLTTIRIITPNDFYKVVFNGFEGAVPNDTKYFNKVQFKVYRRSINQKQYSEIASYDFDTKGLSLTTSQLKTMVACGFYDIMGKLYNFEILYIKEWGERHLSKFNKEVV